ncbi:MAG: hypothetical protein H6631_08895 [Anaerolineaceae bacterium]|nr:hypothetical protein [Anaerolineaceae bacterium]
MSQDKPTGDSSTNKRKRQLNYSAINRDSLVKAGDKSEDDVHLTSEKQGATSKRQNASRPRRKAIARRGEIKWWLGGFLLGFAVGLALSLPYGWILDPHPAPVDPSQLRLEDQNFYIYLIALAYAHDQNEARARARLATLNQPTVDERVANLTETYIERETDLRDIKALVGLSMALGQTSSQMLAFVVTSTPEPTLTPTLIPTPTPRPTSTPTPATPIPTNTATPTPTATRPATRTPALTPTASDTPPATPSRTPTATNTPTPGPNSPFGVAQSTVLCDDSEDGGLLRVYVRDRLGAGLPGVEIEVIWSGGQDTFFTGFKPDIDPGYADFQMEPGELYQVKLLGAGFESAVPEVSIDDPALCPALPDDVKPSWQVVFHRGVN